MNILYVTPLFYPHIGGSETYAEEVANEMKKRGNIVSIFTSDATDLSTLLLKKRNIPRKEVKYRKGVFVKRCPLFYFNGIEKVMYPFRHFLNKEIFQRNPISNIIGGVIQNPFSPAMCKKLLSYGANSEVFHVVNVLGSHTFYAYLASKIHRVPLVITPGIHLHNPAYTQPRFYSILRNSEILAHTMVEAKFCRKIGVSADRIHKVGFGIDVKKYEKGSRKKFREKYHLDDEFVILFLGRLDPRKGIIQLRKAVQEAIKSNDRIRLFFVGPSSTIYRTPKITEFTASLDKKGSCVRYLGVLSEEEKLDALKGADLLAMPSVEDSLGIVYLEAWAAGKPVIGADTPVMREIISDDDGFLVKFGSVSTLKERILTLAHDKDLCIQMGKNGKLKVVKEYNWSRICQKILEIYNGLIKY